MTTVFEVTFTATAGSNATLRGTVTHDGITVATPLAVAEPAAATDVEGGLAQQPGRGESSMIDSLVDQLHALYAERDQLQAALGVSTADEVIGLVEQLRH